MGNCLPISRFMATKVLAVEICETLQSVYDLFQLYTIDHIPVIEKGILKGMIARSTLNQVRPSIYNSTTVEKVMSRQFVFLAKESTLADAEELFNTKLFKFLPIVDGKQNLVGIITPQHLLKAKKYPRLNLNSMKAYQQKLPSTQDKA